MKPLFKKLLIITIAFSFINLNLAKAETDIVDSANKWLMSKDLITDVYFKEINKNGNSLNREPYLTGTRKTIVYGTPHGDTVNINGGTRNRYLGYTMSGANFTNYMYPDDTSGASSYYSRGYNPTRLVKNPWDNPKTRKHSAVISSTGVPANNQFCGKIEFEPYIKEGLRIRSRDEMNRQGIPVDFPTVDYTKEQIELTNWYEYTYIIQPPTDYSWGSGVLFRDGGAGYLTIPIPPNRYNEPSAAALFNEGCIAEPTKKINYVHTNENRQNVTFKIYQFNKFDKVGENEGLALYPYYTMPTDKDTALVKTITHQFTTNKPMFDINLIVPEPTKGNMAGYYITSSETNFQKGVCIVVTNSTGRDAIDHHKQYVIDKARHGFFYTYVDGNNVKYEDAVDVTKVTPYEDVILPLWGFDNKYQ